MFWVHKQVEEKIGAAAIRPKTRQIVFDRAYQLGLNIIFLHNGFEIIEKSEPFFRLVLRQIVLLVLFECKNMVNALYFCFLLFQPLHYLKWERHATHSASNVFVTSEPFCEPFSQL